MPRRRRRSVLLGDVRPWTGGRGYAALGDPATPSADPDEVNAARIERQRSHARPICVFDRRREQRLHLSANAAASRPEPAARPPARPPRLSRRSAASCKRRGVESVSSISQLRRPTTPRRWRAGILAANRKHQERRPAERQ
jgi:hypothetical protein